MLHTSRTIAARPDVLFRLLRDTATWPDWGPSIRGVRGVEGLVEQGTRGHVLPVVGPALPFEVTELVDDGHHGGHWSWRVAGIPATTHEVRRHRARARASVVTFGVPTAAAPYLAVCAVALRRIERLAVGPAA